MARLPVQPPHRLHEAVAGLLVAARDAERVALGSDRRIAFRLTRALLGGARVAGYSAAQLASCLDVSVDSVRNRGASDGWVTARQVALLTGIPSDELAQWHDRGTLTSRHRNDADQDCYLASEVIRGLAQARPRSATASISES